MPKENKKPMKLSFNNPVYIVVWTLVIAIFGPLLGAVQFVMYMSYFGGLSTFRILPLAFMFSMIYFVPALITGFLISAFEKKTFRAWHILIFSMSAPMFTYLWSLYISKIIDDSQFELMIVLVSYTSTVLLTFLLYLFTVRKASFN